MERSRGPFRPILLRRTDRMRRTTATTRKPVEYPLLRAVTACGAALLIATDGRRRRQQSAAVCAVGISAPCPRGVCCVPYGRDDARAAEPPEQRRAGLVVPVLGVERIDQWLGVSDQHRRASRTPRALLAQNLLGALGEVRCAAEQADEGEVPHRLVGQQRFRGRGLAGVEVPDAWPSSCCATARSARTWSGSSRSTSRCKSPMTLPLRQDLHDLRGHERNSADDHRQVRHGVGRSVALTCGNARG
jgi:hypothetical protein